MPDNFGSSIPPGASVYRYPPKRLTFNGSNIHAGGVVATTVHQPRAFRTFQQKGTTLEPLSFLVNLKTHINISLNPNRLQTLRFFDTGRRHRELSLFAERLQVGYTYDPNVVQRVKGEAFAPPTQTVAVTDTTISKTEVNINEGLSLSFGVSDTVTLSLTNWLVAIKPGIGQVSWDYSVRTPYDVINHQRPGIDIDKLPNTSLIGFSFDTIAWFEIFDLTQTSVSFTPSFQLQVTHLEIDLQGLDGTDTHVDEPSLFGDADISKPTAQPLLIDLTKIPDRSKP
jgi:hypothetical protein